MKCISRCNCFSHKHCKVAAKLWLKGIVLVLRLYFSTFCMLDEAETCMPVNVYNLAQGSGVKIGDTVAIPEPFIQHITVNHKGKVCVLKYYGKSTILHTVKNEIAVFMISFFVFACFLKNLFLRSLLYMYLHWDVHSTKERFKYKPKHIGVVIKNCHKNVFIGI